jgi:hypothetical protein
MYHKLLSGIVATEGGFAEHIKDAHMYFLDHNKHLMTRRRLYQKGLGSGWNKIDANY